MYETEYNKGTSNHTLVLEIFWKGKNYNVWTYREDVNLSFVAFLNLVDNK